MHHRKPWQLPSGVHGCNSSLDALALFLSLSMWVPIIRCMEALSVSMDASLRLSQINMLSLCKQSLHFRLPVCFGQDILRKSLKTLCSKVFKIKPLCILNFYEFSMDFEKLCTGLTNLCKKALFSRLRYIFMYQGCSPCGCTKIWVKGTLDLYILIEWTSSLMPNSTTVYKIRMYIKVQASTNISIKINL